METEFNIVHPQINRYLDRLHQGLDETILNEMEDLAREKSFPIVGRAVGAFLEMSARSIGAKRIFEFGSGFGYSAYWFSLAVGSEGRVICTDGRKSNCDLAEQFLSRTGRWDRIEYHQAKAQDVFVRQSTEFDLIFNDVDKEQYLEVWEMAKTKLRPGGLYLADNSLWDGQVAQQEKAEDAPDDCTEAIMLHNEAIARDKGFRFFLNPIRDGVIAALKLP